MTIARHVVVTGRVQGVFFRAWTKGQADALGVAGWVRNCGDGSVEVLVEGDEAAVLALVEQMRSGPPGASVADLRQSESAGQGLRSFDIRR